MPTVDLMLRGHRVLITGASQGIGAALAVAFAGEGCDLRLVARSEPRLVALAESIRTEHGVEVDLLHLDLTRDDAAESVRQFAGNINVLVNNAGAIPSGDLWEVDAARWREAWELKVLGYINITRALYRPMKERGSGVILNNIGIGGQNPDSSYIAGGTGNAALMAFTQALGSTSLQDGVRVIGINPGPVLTDKLIATLKHRAARSLGSEDRYPELLRMYPLGRAATAQEIANAFLFFASERSSYTSGTIVTIDGGMSSRRPVAPSPDV